MSDPASLTQPEDDAQYYRRILHSVIDMAHDIATDLHQQATAPAEPNTSKPDRTIPFDRIACCIRRTILLARKVAEPLPTRPQPNRPAARKRIIRDVEDAIQRKAWEGKIANQDALERELLERLDSPELDEEIDLRDAPEIVKDILRDLGLAHLPGTHPWKRRTPEDIEHLRTRAATPPRRQPRPRPQNQPTAPPTSRDQAPAPGHKQPSEANP